jgi:transcriptional regulator with XRE-family HTH domain
MDETAPTWDLTDRMRKAMQHAGLDARQMADYLGVSRNSVHNWLSGRIEPSTQTLRLWAMRTGVNYDWLRDGKPQVEGGIIAVYCPPAVAA